MCFIKLVSLQKTCGIVSRLFPVGKGISGCLLLGLLFAFARARG
jgi:hypothetical protein